MKGATLVVSWISISVSYEVTDLQLEQNGTA